jgi:hypothetical protein
MAKNTSPKRMPQRPLGPPDGPQQQSPDSSSTPRGAEQGHRRRYVYPRRTQPSTTRRTKTQLIDREGQSVPGEAEAEEHERKPQQRSQNFSSLRVLGSQGQTPGNVRLARW